MGFKKATKTTAKLRAAFYGPAGAGKTFSALRVATGMGGRIGVIDTERGRSAKYADRFDFEIAEPETNTVDGYLALFKMAAKEGFDILIVDSLSHAWKSMLAEVDRLAAAKYKGNPFAAWNEVTPKQERFVEAILTYPGHLFATMRADTEWAQEKDERTGKMKPVKIGLKPQQGKNIEYEFDLLASVTLEHAIIIEKDITGKFQDKYIEFPGEDFGRELAAWLSEGEPDRSDKEAAKQAANAATGGELRPASELPDQHRRGDDSDWHQWLKPPGHVERTDGPHRWYIAACEGLIRRCGIEKKSQAKTLLAWLFPGVEGIDPEIVKTDAATAQTVWQTILDKSNQVEFTRMLGEAIKAEQAAQETVTN